MKWEQDLVRDIRSHSGYDFNDNPDFRLSDTEVSICNLAALAERFSSIKHRCRAILEVGLQNAMPGPLTELLFNQKLNATAYVGVCVHDRSYINDPARNIITIKNDPADFVSNSERFRALNITEFDFILIDDWNSINRALENWEYSRYLSDDGIIAFKNTSIHPGPFRLTNSLDRNKWHVEYNVCTGFDWGIGFARKKL